MKALANRSLKRDAAGSALAKSEPSPPSTLATNGGAHETVLKDTAEQETASQHPRLAHRVAIDSHGGLLPTPYLAGPRAIAATDRFAVVQEKPATEAQQLVCWARFFPGPWAILVGLYFQQSGHHPRQVAGDDQRGHQLLRGRWEVNSRRLDVLADDRSWGDVWSIPKGPDGDKIARIALWICTGGQASFEEGIRQWAEELGTHSDTSRLEPILYRSNWTKDPSFSLDWLVMAGIKRMLPGQERTDLLAQARAESPLFYARCMADQNCG